MYTMMYTSVSSRAAASPLSLTQHKVRLDIDPKWTPASCTPPHPLSLSVCSTGSMNTLPIWELASSTQASRFMAEVRPRDNYSRAPPDAPALGFVRRLHSQAQIWCLVLKRECGVVFPIITWPRFSGLSHHLLTVSECVCLENEGQSTANAQNLDLLEFNYVNIQFLGQEILFCTLLCL